MKEVNREERQKLCGEDGVELLLGYLTTRVLDLPIPEAGTPEARWHSLGHPTLLIDPG